jgi:hypothetical protein
VPFTLPEPAASTRRAMSSFSPKVGIPKPEGSLSAAGRQAVVLRCTRHVCIGSFATCPAWHDVRSTPKADIRFQRNI